MTLSDMELFEAELQRAVNKLKVAIWTHVYASMDWEETVMSELGDVVDRIKEKSGGVK